MATPKIIFWDLETAPIEARTWSLYPKSISHDNIIQDWTIICGAWKEMGSPTVHAVKIDKPYNDKEVVRKLRDVLASADVIVHHNGNKFDIKKLNTRLIYHGLKPLPRIPMVDTLKEVRKVASFSSNRLDYLSKLLVGEGKIPVGYDLWLKVMGGSKKALREMTEYCKTDVIRLEEVYHKILPYILNHPHIGAMKGHKNGCPRCGSKDSKLNGVRYTATGIVRQEHQCLKCHSYYRTTK